MECECDRSSEFEGAEARSYADGHLDKVAIDLAEWKVRYLCPATGREWLMDYPQSEYHGGGPPRLRQLLAADADPTIALPDGTGRLEMPSTEEGYAAAIICRDSDASIRWQALPPTTSADAWVSVHLDGDEVVATSWSGWRVHLDPATGAERGRDFTK